MFRDSRVKNLGAKTAQAGERSGFVGCYESRVARHVSGKDRGKSPLGTHAERFALDSDGQTEG
jgi:hypothetical protein